MKLIKGFILLILLLSCQSIVIADEIYSASSLNINSRPLWRDICPDGLEDASYKEIRWFWPEGTKSTQAIYNYWSDRRHEFYESLKQCDTLHGGYQNTCYQNLRNRQMFYNDQYKRDIQKQQISQQIWRDIHDKGSSPIMINIFQH